MTIAQRHEGFREELLRSRISQVEGQRAKWPVHRVLFTVGAMLVPSGLSCLVIGWIQIARTVFVFDQLPYLASWGLIGLALVVLGGFFYFAYWNALSVQQGRQQLELLRSIHESLVLAGATAPTVAAPAGLVVTSAGSMFHRAECSVIRSAARVRSVTAAETLKLKPCGVCRPQL
ncbi:hypothetical protein [Humibacter sp.]|uniref:hypothetical protein n=1 Tax=Humibacter sp. TaxID=1940291 RepID=UPI002D1A31F2|nr:hypothetical protein [Humibacter sp.]HVX09185.1 hypothetical protein [Humibacter sp.]